MSQQEQIQYQVSWIGLGNMGRGMARNIVTKANLQHPMIIFNRTISRATDFASSLEKPSSVQVVESVSAAVKPADIIFTSLGDDASVVSIYDEILTTSGPVKGKLFIETSTILPETTNSIAEKVLAAGAEFVASPVFGAPAMADAGSLVVVAAGEASSIDKASPFFTGVIGRSVIDLRGHAPGKALLLKLTGNSFIISMVETLAEGHAWAEKSGLGSELLHKFIENMMPGPFVAYSNRMMSGDYLREDPLFAVDLARKDAGHAIKLAGSVGVDMKITKIADDHLKTVKEVRGEKGDLPAIYGAVRKESGLDFSNRK
ncbi:NAD binding domain of 6-phosphogluconate dehydrogenase-domain-containing protein [Pyronema omphalodes]|nr:NAD binding domain of 6-phosphogluconate dehydrogenase-domain-containing protein [Pyronema omphalodes]